MNRKDRSGMADLKQVKERLAILISLDSEALEAFSPLAEDALARAQQMLRPGTSQDDPRIAGIAAADCALQIACIEQGKQPGSFTAGSLKISRADAVEDYSRLYQQALEGAQDLLQDRTFRFFAV